jgi:hypothetical protein
MSIYLEAGYNPIPTGNCKRSCGNTTIPFPFGLEKGCYALEQFRLDCKSQITLLPRGSIQYQVDHIPVNEGYLSVIDVRSGANSEGIQIADRTKDGFFDVTYVRGELFDLSEVINMKIHWAVRNLTCAVAMRRQNQDNFACRSVNSTCLDVTYGDGTTQLGYRCMCPRGFEGNPYVPDGCKGNLTSNVSLKYAIT